MAREKKDRSGLGDEARSFLRKSILVGLGCMAGFALVGAGIFKVYGYVDHQVAYSTVPLKVVLKDRPVWMSDFLAEQICDAAKPPGPHSALDRDLLKTAKVLLQDNSKTNAWIKEIRQLKLAYGERPGDTLVLDCEFRAPVALVHWQGKYTLVDVDGVTLPEQYTAEQISKVVYGRDGRINIRVVEGVRSDRPGLDGQPWKGEDMAAALGMIRKLYGRPWADEIIKVDISNLNGQQDKREAQIVLHTRRNTQIRWGRPVESTDLAEVTCAEKLGKLEEIYRQYGRVDAGEPWIDVRFDRVTRPVDGAIPTASSK